MYIRCAHAQAFIGEEVKKNIVTITYARVKACTAAVLCTSRIRVHNSCCIGKSRIGTLHFAGHTTNRRLYSAQMRMKCAPDVRFDIVLLRV